MDLETLQRHVDAYVDNVKTNFAMAANPHVGIVHNVKAALTLATDVSAVTQPLGVHVQAAVFGTALQAGLSATVGGRIWLIQEHIRQYRAGIRSNDKALEAEALASLRRHYDDLGLDAGGMLS